MDVVFLSLTKLNLPLLNRSPPNLPVNIVVSDDGLNHTDITCCSLESRVAVPGRNSVAYFNCITAVEAM